ncbi:MAG: WS/DGAT domain-containing protein [Myxococcota bacterium]
MRPAFGVKAGGVHFSLRVGQWLPTPVNLVVSNVPGPRHALQMGPYRLEDIASVGPLLGQAGLNITAWSYDGTMTFALLADPNLTPDLGALAADIGPALAELEAIYLPPQAAAA